MTTIEIDIPKLHSGQRPIADSDARWRVVRCGRRFGKTIMGEVSGIDTLLTGHPVGWFAPTHKILAPAWREIVAMCKPIISDLSKTELRFETINGGSMEFWSVDNPDAGRSRKYKRVILDEAGIMRNLQDVWYGSVRPTLSDYRGDALFLGTPRGATGLFNQFYSKGEQHQYGWASWCCGTADNPHISRDEIEEAREMLPDQAFKQEYLGIPADDGGNPFGLKAIAACTADHPSHLGTVVFGVDLAKSHDWTWVVGLDEHGHQTISERWQGQWSTTRSRLIQIIGDRPAMIDSTGVGDPIVEDLQTKLPNVQGFRFSSTSKQQLMEGLASAIQMRQVKFCDLHLISELETFAYEYTKTGVRYSAPDGMHDDGVCALALAVHASRDEKSSRFVFSVPTYEEDFDDDF